MSNPLVSIIVPIYNVEKYIERCIESVKAQTYAQWECICVDDCTPDKSVEEVEKITRGDKRFSILHHDTNRGLSAARNTGTRAAKGEYVYYLDSDDELTPICIESLVRLAEKYPKAEIIQGSTRSIPEANEDWRDINNKIDYPEYTEDKDWIMHHFYALKNFIPVNAWNKLIKKAWIDAVGDELLFVEGIIHEDERWLFDVAEYISAIAFTCQITYLHYQTEGSIMTSKAKSNYKSVSSMIIIFDDALQYMKEPSRDYKLVYLVALAVSRYLIINPKTKERELICPYRKSLKRLLGKVLASKQWYLAWTIYLTLLCPLTLGKGVRYINRVNIKYLEEYQNKF
jgi:glycosyltransferase involved in cell wall biosynthesis